MGLEDHRVLPKRGGREAVREPGEDGRGEELKGSSRSMR